MTTKTTDLSRVLVLMLFLVAPAVVAQDNPHWNKTTCEVCHDNSKPVDGSADLKGGDAEVLCDTCHGGRGSALPCRHASDIAVGEQDVGDNFRASLKDEKLVCTTCHDAVYQCEHPSKQYSFMNPGFLRDRTSPATGEYCFECHEESGLQKLNPHQGVADELQRPTCPLCHVDIPGTGATGQLVVDFNMQYDLNDACRGCHVVQPHPKNSFSTTQTPGWDHLVTPSAEVLQNMQEAKVRTGIGLPLNPLNGEVFCATCHNPHDFKIGGEHGSEEVVADNLLRMTGICQACHDK